MVTTHDRAWAALEVEAGTKSSTSVGGRLAMGVTGCNSDGFVQLAQGSTMNRLHAARLKISAKPGGAGFLCLLLLVLSVTGSVTIADTFSNTAAITIPAQGVGTPYPSTIDVLAVTGAVTKVTVKLNHFSHTYPDDVDVLLVGPTGQSVLLMSDAGGSAEVNNIGLTFDDAAADSLPDSTQIVSGTYKPTNFGTGDTFPGPETLLWRDTLGLQRNGGRRCLVALYH